MKKIALVALALSTPAMAEPTATTIVVDNRTESCNADSRIAEGNRKRAQWKANAIVRRLKVASKPYKVIYLESLGHRGGRYQIDGKIVSIKVC
jgi:hypothetical protein